VEVSSGKRWYADNAIELGKHRGIELLGWKEGLEFDGRVPLDTCVRGLMKRGLRRGGRRRRRRRMCVEREGRTGGTSRNE
jgi:hypothetical protein